MVLGGASKGHLPDDAGIDQTVAVIDFDEDAPLIVENHF